MRAVLFDLFFTLVDPLGRETESEYAILGMNRVDFEARNALDYEVRACGKIRNPYEMMEHILRGLDIPPERIRRATDARLERIRRALQGVEEKNVRFLEKIRAAGFKTALISNADIMDVYYWEDSPLCALFDETLFSYYEGLLKPDPRIYRLAVRRLGLDPGCCFFAGDGGHGELRGAREAGISTVLTTEYVVRVWPEKIEALKEDADFMVNTLEAIWSIITA
jgi:putative hydrolase of the HAD superfamily